MGAGSDIRAGKAYVELYLDKSLLVKGLKGVAGELRAFGAGVSSMGKQLMAAGLSVTAPMLVAANSWASSGAELYRMSQRTGMAVEQLSALKFAAETSGVEMETLETSIKKMQKAVYAAAQGKGEGPAFLNGLFGMDPEKQLEAIADKLAGVTNPAERAAVAIEIFGRGGTAMLPMLAGGAKGLAEFRKEAEAMGRIRSAEDAKAALALSIAWAHVTGALGGLKNAFGSAIGPLLTGTLNGLQANIMAARDWVKENKPLIVQVFQIGAAAVGAGIGLYVVGKAIIFAAGAFSFAAKVVGVCGHALGLVTTVLGVLANPIVLVTVGLAALAGYFLYTSGAAGKAVAYISGVFRDLLGDLTSTLGVIADSLAAGDLASAVKVGWALIRMEWTKGVNFLQSLWDGFRQYWDEAITGIALGFVNLGAMLRSVWADVLNWLSKQWQKWATSTFEEGLADLITPIMAKILGVDTEELRKTMHEDFAAKRAAQPKDFAAMDAETEAQKKQIEKDRAGASDQLGGGLAQRNKEREAKAKAAADEEAAARKEWENAKEDARAKAAAAKGKPFNVPGFDPGDMALQAAHGAVSTRGTFSATAVGGLAEGGPIQELHAMLKEKMEKFIFVGEQTTLAVKQVKLEAAP